MGAAIINGYDTVETMMAGKMDAEEIAEAQKDLLKDYDLEIGSDQVSAAMYRDSNVSISYDYLYQMTTMSKTEWISTVAKVLGISDEPGVEEYLSGRYDEYYNAACKDVYYGADSFLAGDNGGLYHTWLDRGALTESELKEFYIHFCKIEYDPAFTQALMQHFGCSEDEVYLEHSDVVVELAKTKGQDLEYKVSEIVDKYNTPLKETINMIVKAHTSYDEAGVAEALSYLYNYFGI